jgi:hypothetical protein
MTRIVFLAQLLLVFIMILFMNSQRSCADDGEGKIRQLIKDINKDPDPTHADHTPAAFELINIGRPSIKPCLELMGNEELLTRMRAYRVITQITMRELGFKPGKGWVSEEAEKKWVDLWEKNGALHWKKDKEHNQESIELWKKWIDSGKK